MDNTKRPTVNAASSPRRVNMDIDRALWRRVKVAAASQGITARELVENALRAVLEKQEMAEGARP